jgi:DNA-binding CsgD family transcriptional regulator
MKEKPDLANIDGLVYCLKDEQTKVLYQNEACVKLCSDLEGQPCSKGCMGYFSKETATNKDRNGFHFFEKRNIEGKNFDIAILKKPGVIASYLHPSQDNSENSKALIEKENLTKREREILSLKLEHGLTIKEICEKLFISRATLKTHINNINKKIAQHS